MNPPEIHCLTAKWLKKTMNITLKCYSIFQPPHSHTMIVGAVTLILDHYGGHGAKVLFR